MAVQREPLQLIVGEEFRLTNKQFRSQYRKQQTSGLSCIEQDYFIGEDMGPWQFTYCIVYLKAYSVWGVLNENLKPSHVTEFYSWNVKSHFYEFVLPIDSSEVTLHRTMAVLLLRVRTILYSFSR